jgi:hypothetical protein
LTVESAYEVWPFFLDSCSINMLDKEALSQVGANKLWVDDEEADAEKAFQGGYISLEIYSNPSNTQFATISTSRNIFTVHLFIILAIYHQNFPPKDQFNDWILIISLQFTIL